MTIPIPTLIVPPRGSPPAATSSPGSTTLHRGPRPPPARSPPGGDDAAPSAEPLAVRHLHQQKADRLRLVHLEVAGGAARAPHVDASSDVAPHALRGLERGAPPGRRRERILRVDETGDDRGVCGIEALLHRPLRAHAGG